MPEDRGPTETPPERVLLVGLVTSSHDLDAGEESLEELALLAETAGAEAVGRVLQVRKNPDPATYIGKGKAKEVVERARRLKASAIIFDDELAPAQGRNLEDLAGVNPLAADAMKIIDRTGLILDVFAQHAQSAEGKLQVELAQINYLVPRLRGWGEVMSRIGGGRAAGGGASGPGLGTRGPGETKLEVDRRRISRRLSKLNEELKDVERTRRVKRSRRLSSGIPQIGLVGYTNAGKSTLLNALTGAGVLVEDRLFSTLDPTVRRVELPGGGKAVMVDTVGFVRKLPHQLVEAFRSTLEETVESDLLLQVADATKPDPAADVEAVNRVLSDIGAGEIPRVLALNKSELLDGKARRRLRELFPEAVFISAARSEGLEDLAGAIEMRLPGLARMAEFRIPFDRGDLRSRLHEEAEVVKETSGEDGMVLVVKAAPAIISRYRDFLVA